MNTDAALVDYYARRAGEYERIYQKPERHDELLQLKQLLRAALCDRHAIEVACGTGYWTEVTASSAASIAAFDINQSTLEIARSKGLDSSNVTFAVGDAYHLPPARRFNAAFAMFWWSHIPRSRLNEFLQHLHERLLPGATVVFADNTYVPGNSTPITRTDADSNTYQMRRLDSGETFEVLKNYPADGELRGLVAGYASQIEIRWFKYYWWLSYRLSNAQTDFMDS
jgi:demethylmenaquinone methyltransferase/2-methoxy-6-polyprenyl-1,4-benzoquinol methylase